MSVTIRDAGALARALFDNEGVETLTSDEQCVVERSIRRLYHTLGIKCRLETNLPKLLRADHERFLKQNLVKLPSGYEALDASRTWICYWILHSLSLLEVEVSELQLDNITNFIAKCQHPDGGFGGGPGQFPHLATTYAAVNALCIIGTKKAYDIINRSRLENFVWRVRSPEGAFSMHEDGEVDIRGTYCALAVATLTNIATPKLFEGTAEWIVGCQSYEGGFAGCPGMEAHGGYAFCGLSALFLLQKTHLCDLKALLRWTVNRQMKYEGGFQGRTNKLVDGCYSFWQGAAFPIIHKLLEKEGFPPDSFLFDQGALQEYILLCCQHYNGGLLDKPGKHADVYHTCYTASGLSIAQHSLKGLYILGTQSNKLAETNPVFNIRPHFVMKAMSYFNGQRIVEEANSLHQSHAST